MKIGIITFHQAVNFGAVLQAYALKKVFSIMGFHTFFIDYQYPYLEKGFKLWLGKTPITTLKKIIIRIRNSKFKKFRSKYLYIEGGRHLKYSDLLYSPPDADIFVCGSDQIWNPNFLRNFDDERFFWLDFVHIEKKKIAYAASFGVPRLDQSLIERLSKYPGQFHAISVREKSGIDIMKSLGFDKAALVPDPTLLLDSDEYNEIEDIKKYKHPYLFMYQLGIENIGFINTILKNVKKKLNLKCIKCRPEHLSISTIKHTLMSPGAWLHSIHCSTFVITNSYHGVIFSLLFHKPFICILRGNKSSEMNDRILTLLSGINLEDRIINTDDIHKVDFLLDSFINWEEVDYKINILRNDGYSFLNNNLF